MASYTGNLNLKKPALDDDALITDINNNMDILDAAVNGIQDGLAIVANGNTHVAITSGQFVYVRNHGTLTEGLYVASSNIAANATLSTSNLTADAAGGLNALNGKFITVSESVLYKATSTDYEYTGLSIVIPANTVYILNFEARYNSGNPNGAAVSFNNSQFNSWELCGKNEGLGFVSVCGKNVNNAAFTLYFWAKRASVPSTANPHYCTGLFIKG